MYAIEFEADIRDGLVKIPEIYPKIRNKHARIVVLVTDDEVEPDLKAFSEHSASLVEDWHDLSEDEVWT